MTDNERSESCVPGCTVDTCVDHYPKAPASQVSSSDRAREEFEAWWGGWQSSNPDWREADGIYEAGYNNPFAASAYSAWQAAIDSQRLALEKKDREIAKLTEGGERMYMIQQAEIERLQSRIQHMDNACLDNFGVTITSILD